MGFVKIFLRNLSILIALVATAIGLVGKHAPHLFMKLPMGFIPWAITGHFVPPYFDNTMWLDSGLREWVRDGDVVVAVDRSRGKPTDTFTLGTNMKIFKVGGDASI